MSPDAVIGALMVLVPLGFVVLVRLLLAGPGRRRAEAAADGLCAAALGALALVLGVLAAVVQAHWACGA